MKKLMIAAAIVCAAALSQGSTVDWGATADVFGDGNGAELTGGQNAYLISGTYGQAALLSALVQAGSVSAFESTLAAQKLDATTVTGGAQVSKSGGTTSALTGGTAETAYIAIVNGDNLYISTIVNALYDGLSDTYTFTYNSSYDPYDASWEPVMDAAGGLQGDYNGAGWYTAVPEPTSGLLLLLGVAGLALRRRRA